MGSPLHQFLFLVLSYCLFARAAVIDVRSNGALEERAESFCSKPVVNIANNVLSKYPSAASQICSTILGRTPPSTVTQTSTVLSTETFALTGSTTGTVSFGVRTVSDRTTLSETTTTTTTTTASTSTITIPVDFTPATVTTTTTTYAYNPAVQRRQGQSNVAQRFPGAPRPIGVIALSLASSACSCFLGPVATPETTAFVTFAQTSTVNSISTSTITVPSSTLSTTETVTTSSTATDLLLRTATTITTSTRTAPAPTSTVVVVQRATFQVVTGPSQSCTYNRYYDFPSANNNPGPAGDYKDAVRACQEICARDSRCKFFLYLRFDPARARGFDGAACLFDDQPYDPALLQCNYPTQYYIGVNRLT